MNTRHFAFAMALPAFLFAQSSNPLPLPRTTLQNGEWKDGELGQVPNGWIHTPSSQKAGFRAELAEDEKLSGRRCLILSREEGGGSRGSLEQSLDAKPFRGKRVRLKGLLRCDSPENPHKRVGMWLRVDRLGKEKGFFDEMDCRLIGSDTWTAVEIVGDVAPDAETLNLGVVLYAIKGKGLAGPVVLETLGETPRPVKEGPKALSAQGLQNLVTFTKALGYVRFFHPSDEAAQANWNRLAIEGVRAIEGASSAKELARRLNTFFAPYAPSAQFLAPGQQPKPLMAPPAATQLVRWHHWGFGPALGSRGGPYESHREYAPASGKPEGWAGPLSTQVKDLGGGVKALIPSVCYTNAEKMTLPRSAVPMPSMPDPTVGSIASDDDRTTRLGSIALAWGVFQHFYPYFDVVKTDWNAELPKALTAAAQDKDSAAFVHTLRRFTAALKDGHAQAVRPDQPYGFWPDLGIRLIEGRPIIQRTGGDAKPIPLGSEILLVDGETAKEVMNRLRGEISAATEGCMNKDLQFAFLIAPDRTPVKLRFRTPNGRVLDASLKRLGQDDPREAQTQTEKIKELRPGIWYVDLARNTPDEFKKGVTNWAETKALIFDLRGYPRGVHSLLQHFTDKTLESPRWMTPVITEPDGRGWTWDETGRWKLAPLTPRIKGKVVFLAGGGAISYAESCLGIIEAYKLGEIIGEPTAGTNGTVNPFDLPGGCKIFWTGMKVLKHDGGQHHGVGIQPTVLVRPTVKGLAEGQDEVLEKALEIVSK